MSQVDLKRPGVGNKEVFSSSFEEVEVLRERAYMFLDNSKYLVERGGFDLAAFSLEQYCQLLLKYKLLVKTGRIPGYIP